MYTITFVWLIHMENNPALGSVREKAPYKTKQKCDCICNSPKRNVHIHLIV